MTATLSILSLLAFATACTATTSGSERLPTEDDDSAVDAPTAPRKTLSSADESVPAEEETAKCGGFPFNDKACGTCGASRCCAAATTCWENAECRALSQCVSACDGDDDCTSTCATTHADGVSSYTGVASCASSKCATECQTTPPPPPPASQGIGNRCSSDSDCREGLCSGSPGWCTTLCTDNYDCAGYPQLNNELGKFNYCLETESGASTCFPGCSTDADCGKYASGLTCQGAGNGVYVCSR